MLTREPALSRLFKISGVSLELVSRTLKYGGPPATTRAPNVLCLRISKILANCAWRQLVFWSAASYQNTKLADLRIDTASPFYFLIFLLYYRSKNPSSQDLPHAESRRSECTCSPKHHGIDLDESPKVARTWPFTSKPQHCGRRTMSILPLTPPFCCTSKLKFLSSSEPTFVQYALSASDSVSRKEGTQHLILRCITKYLTRNSKYKQKNPAIFSRWLQMSGKQRVRQFEGAEAE